MKRTRSDGLTSQFQSVLETAVKMTITTIEDNQGFSHRSCDPGLRGCFVRRKDDGILFGKLTALLCELSFKESDSFVGRQNLSGTRASAVGRRNRGINCRRVSENFFRRHGAGMSETWENPRNGKRRATGRKKERRSIGSDENRGTPLGRQSTASRTSDPCQTAAMSAVAAPHVANACVWHVRVFDMSGAALVVPCPQKEHTSIGDLKCALQLLNPDFAAARSSLVVRPIPCDEAENAGTKDRASKRPCLDATGNKRDANASVHGAESVDSNGDIELNDRQTMKQCGLGNGAALDVLVRDFSWSESDRALQDKIMTGGPVASFMYGWNGVEHTTKIDVETAKAIAWVLTVRYETPRHY